MVPDWFRHSEVSGLEVRGPGVRVRKRLSKNFTFIAERSAVLPHLRVRLLQGTVLTGEELVAVLYGAELLEVSALKIASGSVIRVEVHVSLAEILERSLSRG